MPHLLPLLSPVLTPWGLPPLPQTAPLHPLLLTAPLPAQLRSQVLHWGGPCAAWLAKRVLGAVAASAAPAVLLPGCAFALFLFATVCALAMASRAPPAQLPVWWAAPLLPLLLQGGPLVPQHRLPAVLPPHADSLQGWPAGRHLLAALLPSPLRPAAAAIAPVSAAAAAATALLRERACCRPPTSTPA